MLFRNVDLRRSTTDSDVGTLQEKAWLRNVGRKKREEDEPGGLLPRKYRRRRVVRVAVGQDGISGARTEKEEESDEPKKALLHNPKNRLSLPLLGTSCSANCEEELVSTETGCDGLG